MSASYFQALGIQIVAGRPFSSVDTATSVPVCIVDEAFVRRYLRGRPPLGARVVVRGMGTGRSPLPVRDIVGVAGQVKERPDEFQPEPHIYARRPSAHVSSARSSSWIGADFVPHLL